MVGQVDLELVYEPLEMFWLLRSVAEIVYVDCLPFLHPIISIHLLQGLFVILRGEKSDWMVACTPMLLAMASCCTSGYLRCDAWTANSLSLSTASGDCTAAAFVVSAGSWVPLAGAVSGAGTVFSLVVVGVVVATKVVSKQ
jgi:hypothetical protein